MRRILLALLIMAGWAQFAQAAGDAPLRSMVTADDTKGWEAVGRLNLAGKGFCTGALIREDLVLTAAHCLYDKKTGKRIDATKVEFLAGWRNGRAAAYRNVRRAVLHPDYVFSSAGGEARISNDLALLELTQPIRSTSIKPFETFHDPAAGDQVAVVSYAHDRAELPSIQKVCYVLARQSGTLVLSCEVDFGSSGAPIFSMVDGQPRIVSVVSAKAQVNTQRVSLGATLGGTLQYLLSELKRSDGVFSRPAPKVRTMSLAGAREETGAKFIKPASQ